MVQDWARDRCRHVQISMFHHSIGRWIDCISFVILLSVDFRERITNRTKRFLAVTWTSPFRRSETGHCCDCDPWFHFHLICTLASSMLALALLLRMIARGVIRVIGALEVCTAVAQFPVVQATRTETLIASAINSENSYVRSDEWSAAKFRRSAMPLSKPLI